MRSPPTPDGRGPIPARAWWPQRPQTDGKRSGDASPKLTPRNSFQLFGQGDVRSGGVPAAPTCASGGSGARHPSNVRVTGTTRPDGRIRPDHSPSTRSHPAEVRAVPAPPRITDQGSNRSKLTGWAGEISLQSARWRTVGPHHLGGSSPGLWCRRALNETADKHGSHAEHSESEGPEEPPPGAVGAEAPHRSRLGVAHHVGAHGDGP
jgi:hypothetical protein